MADSSTLTPSQKLYRAARKAESRAFYNVMTSYDIKQLCGFLTLLCNLRNPQEKKEVRGTYPGVLVQHRMMLINTYRDNKDLIPTELLDYVGCASNTLNVENARFREITAQSSRADDVIKQLKERQDQIFADQIKNFERTHHHICQESAKCHAERMKIKGQFHQWSHQWSINWSRHNNAQFQELKDRLGKLEKHTGQQTKTSEELKQNMKNLLERNQFLKNKVQFLEDKVKSLQEPAKESSPVLNLQHDTERTASPLMQVQPVAKGGTGETTDSASVESFNGYWKREEFASSAPTPYGEETPHVRGPDERKKVSTSTRVRDLPQHIYRSGRKFRVKFGGQHVGNFKNLEDAKTAVKQCQKKRKYLSSSSARPAMIDTPLKRRRSGKNSWMGFSNYPPLHELVRSIICKASHTSKQGMNKKVAAKLWKSLNQEQRDVFGRVDSDDAKSWIMKALEKKRETLIAEIRTEAAKINEQAYSLFHEEQPLENTKTKFDGLSANEKMMYVKMAQNSDYF